MKIRWNDEWIDLRGVPEVFVEDPSDPGNYIASRIYIGEEDPAYGGENPYAWLKPSDLETGYRLIDEDKAYITTGNITLNATAVTDLTATQMTLQGAQTGDIVFFGASMVISPAASTKCFDAYTYVSSARTNPFSAGLSASLASTGGFQAWFHASNSGSFDRSVSGTARRTLVSGDISSGNVVVGLAYAGANSTSKILSATANNPFEVFAQLWRP